MNEGGNHGGSDTGETEAALVLASPKFRTMRVKNTHECPNLPANGTIFDYYRKVEQQDLVSTLSALLGLPIPRNSIGTLLSELRGMWPDEESYVHVLARNAQQLWRISQTVFDPSAARKEETSWSTVAQNRTLPTNACPVINNTVEKLSCLFNFRRATSPSIKHHTAMDQYRNRLRRIPRTSATSIDQRESIIQSRPHGDRNRSLHSGNDRMLV
jgi:hypothetical protein